MKTHRGTLTGNTHGTHSQGLMRTPSQKLTWTHTHRGTLRHTHRDSHSQGLTLTGHTHRDSLSQGHTHRDTLARAQRAHSQGLMLTEEHTHSVVPEPHAQGLTGYGDHTQ